MPDPVFEHWFDARRLYQRGVPDAVTTALEAFPRLRAEVEAKIRWFGAERILEVGPGRIPLAPLGPRTVFLDLADAFLRPLSGGRVVGDLRRAPFRDDAFELGVAADVFTHLAPAARGEALRSLARLAPRIALFNPEPGTPEVPGSQVPTEELTKPLARLGYICRQRDYRAQAPGHPDFTMALVTAVRSGVRLRVTDPPKKT